MRFLATVLLCFPLFALDNGVRLTNNQASDLTDWVHVVHRVFAQGEISGYPRPYVDGAAASSWQADVHSRWTDGSVKSAHVSFVATVPSGGDLHIDFRDQSNACHLGNKATCEGAALTKQQMLDFDTGGGTGSWGAAIQTTTGGDTQTTSGRAMLNACPTITSDMDSLDCRYYQRGPLVTQVVVEDSTNRAYDYGYLCLTNCTAPYDTATWEKHTTAGPSYRHLHPGFVFTFIPSKSSVKTEYWMETAWAGTNTVTDSQALGAQKYSLTLYDGSAETNSIFTDSDVIHGYAATWRKIFWQGTDLDVWDDAGTKRLRVLTDFNFEYLIHVGAIPQFDLSISIDRTDENSQWDKWRDTYENGDKGALMGTGGFMTTEGNDNPATSFITQLENAHLWWDAIFFLYSMNSTGPSVYEGSYRVLWDYQHPGWGGNAATLQYFPTHLREEDPSKLFCGLFCSDTNDGVLAYGRPISREARPAIYTSSVTNSANGADRLRTALLTAGTSIAVDSAHYLENHFISWLIHGDWWWRREMQYFASYFAGVTGGSAELSISPYGCRADITNAAASTGCGMYRFAYQGQQVRASAWGMLALARAAYASPTTDANPPVSSPEAEYFENALNNNIAVREGRFEITGGRFYVKNSGGTDEDPCPLATYDFNTATAWCAGRVGYGYEHYSPKPSNPLGFLDIANDTTASVIYYTAQWDGQPDLDITKVNKATGLFQAYYNWIAWGVIEDMGFDQIGPLRRWSMKRLLNMIHAANEQPGAACALFNLLDVYQAPTQPTSGNARIQVTDIMNANPAEVTTSEPHGYNTSDVVRLCCGTGAWAAANSPSGTAPSITVTGANTFTIPVDASAFGSFTGQQFYVSKGGNTGGSPLQTYADLVGSYAHYVMNPPATSRCDWVKDSTGSYSHVGNVDSYPHQARAAATWLLDVNDGNLSGGRAFEILDGTMIYQNLYEDSPRYALQPRQKITNFRQAELEVLATAPAGTACTYLASQGAITDPRDDGDVAAPQAGRHVAIDMTPWTAGTWSVRLTCGAARQTISVTR